MLCTSKLLEPEELNKLFEESELLKIKDVMVTDVVTVDAGVNVREATKRMDDYEIGCLLVMEKGSIIGILTERDVLKRVVAEARRRLRCQ